MNTPADANTLILEIYDTILDASLWPSVLDKTARFIGARGAFIFELEGLGAARRITAPFFSGAYEQALVDSYLRIHKDQELADQDTFARLSKPTDSIQLIPDEVLAGSEAELLARPNVRQMMEYGIRYRAGALLNKDQINNDRFALQLSERAGPVSKEHLAKASLLMPHLAKALNVSRPTMQLARKYKTISDCLDMLVVGVCVLDAKGTIVIANREFQRQLESYGAFRKDSSGRLVISSQGTQNSFIQLRGSVQNHGKFGARPRKEAIVSDIEGKPHTLCIEVAPLTSAKELDEPRLEGHIVYSMDTGNFYSINADMLAGLFSLTRTESSILELVAEGMTNVQISERRSKSVETVNSQVKSILEKTQSANRTQLIRLVTNICASFITESHHQNG